jgi:hypothetical protein
MLSNAPGTITPLGHPSSFEPGTPTYRQFTPPSKSLYGEIHLLMAIRIADRFHFVVVFCSNPFQPSSPPAAMQTPLAAMQNRA